MRHPRTLALALLAGLALACIDPADRRPGLRLSGEVVDEPIADWSFTDSHREIYIETRPPWLIPHSVTIVCASLDGGLYVGARNPTQKRWVAHVARDPDVRLKIGERVYELRLEPIEDAAEHERVYAAFAGKYERPLAAPADRPPQLYYRVLPRDEST